MLNSTYRSHLFLFCDYRLIKREQRQRREMMQMNEANTALRLELETARRQAEDAQREVRLRL